MPEFSADHAPAQDAGRDTWRAHWSARDLPWRMEPEITAERQAELGARLALAPNVEQGDYPFKHIVLTRADVEWLLATHEQGRGPVDWHGERLWRREGVDLRGAYLRGVDLRFLPLARVRASLSNEEWERATADQREMAAVHLEGAMLQEAHLEGAFLRNAHLEGADLSRAFLYEAKLRGAHLEGASLREAHLEGARLQWAHLHGKALAEGR